MMRKNIALKQHLLHRSSNDIASTRPLVQQQTILIVVVIVIIIIITDITVRFQILQEHFSQLKVKDYPKDAEI